MNQKQQKQKTAGFTLVELLVALSLVGVVLAAAGTMLLQAYASESAYREQNQAQQNARTAADIISDDLRGAAVSPVVPSAFNSAGYSFSIYNDSGTATGINYTLASGNLSRSVNAGTATVVARNITSLAAPRTGNTVDVDVTATTGTSIVRVRAKVTLRNYLLLP